MKSFLIFTTLFLTQFSDTFAAEVKYLTQDEYLSLMKQNAPHYEEVIPGMTVEYTDTGSVYTNDVLTATCSQSGKDTVLAQSSTHYLVYRSLRMNSDCDLYQKGDVLEFLNWRKIRTVEDEKVFLLNELFNPKIIQLNSNTIMISGSKKRTETPEEVPFKVITRLGVSQFRSTHLLIDENYHYTLHKVSEEDTTKVNVSRLLNLTNFRKRKP